MLQNDVLENGIFKPRPKLAESSSKLARLAPIQLVSDGWSSGRAEWPGAARRGSYDHSERSEPEGVMPPLSMEKENAIKHTLRYTPSVYSAK